MQAKMFFSASKCLIVSKSFTEPAISPVHLSPVNPVSQEIVMYNKRYREAFGELFSVACLYAIIDERAAVLWHGLWEGQDWSKLVKRTMSIVSKNPSPSVKYIEI